MHLIQNESRYSIEFRKGHFYIILYLNQYIFSYTDKHLNVFLILVILYQVGCIFPMVISSEFRMEQYRDDDLVPGWWKTHTTVVLDNSDKKYPLWTIFTDETDIFTRNKIRIRFEMFWKMFRDQSISYRQGNPLDGLSL